MINFLYVTYGEKKGHRKTFTQRKKKKNKYFYHELTHIIANLISSNPGVEESRSSLSPLHGGAGGARERTPQL